MKAVYAFIFALNLSVIICKNATAAPDAILIERWTAHDPSSQQQVDHSPFNDLLSSYRYVGDDFIARFAYDKVSKADHAKLISYLNYLQSVKVSSLNRNVQYAFWVNLYNSLTISVILAHYPVNTIRDINISPGFFTTGPWGAKLVTIEGHSLSLDDIEHGILRPIWKDPRTHYILNCASLGCPDLPKKAIDPDNLEPILEKAARNFINHERAFRLTPDKEVVVNSIYRWFAEDFGTSDKNILTHIAQYASPVLSVRLQGKTHINDDHYAWQLNN
ncbi:DUF547 domain-containing protein [Sneathiella glossodoripedis]|uniref:DUF547 domain-containing protein n=1 Tax=Sneathiella glossodoripedis TaxID=418853 RepID=UPI00068509A0|nr:DUF547 domain-containing protein [Sneathiella glossodoripedis]